MANSENLRLISSNWTSNPDIEKCFEGLNEEGFKGFSDDLIDPAKCCQLSPNNEITKPPQLLVTLKQPSQKVISRICLVSQCKRIEVYTGDLENSGQYLKTSTGTLSEESDDDFKVYINDVEIEDSVHSQITIKLIGVQNACWILSLIIVSKPSMLKNDRFNLSAMNSMLDQDIQLSDKAKDFKKLFETFQQSKPPGLDPMALMNQELDPMQLMKSIPMAPPPTNHDCQSCTEQIQSLEKRIMNRLDTMERNQNAKLDQILTLLNNKAD